MTKSKSFEDIGRIARGKQHKYEESPLSTRRTFVHLFASSTDFSSYLSLSSPSLSPFLWYKNSIGYASELFQLSIGIEGNGGSSARCSADLHKLFADINLDDSFPRAASTEFEEGIYETNDDSMSIVLCFTPRLIP